MAVQAKSNRFVSDRKTTCRPPSERRRAYGRETAATLRQVGPEEGRRNATQWQYRQSRTALFQIGKQPVDRRLNVGAHMAGKLPRRCDKSVQRKAGEMPLNGSTGKVEPLCFRSENNLSTAV